MPLRMLKALGRSINDLIKVKEETDKLLKAKFIIPTRYVQWLEILSL